MSLLDEIGGKFTQPYTYRTKEGLLKAREIKHDVIHLLLVGPDRERPIRLLFEDEYSGAIVQAVIEGSSRITHEVSYLSASGGNVGHEPITPRAVRERLIPGVVTFLGEIIDKRGWKRPTSFRDDVSDEFIQYYIAVGKAFRDAFRRQYRMEYMDMGIEWFIRLSFSDLQEVYDRAVYGVQQALDVRQVA